MSVLSHLKLPEHQYTPQVPVIDAGLISSTAQSISRQHEAAKEGWNNIENKVIELSQNANPYERNVLNRNFANVSVDIQKAVEEGRYREIADKLPAIHRNLVKESLPVIDSIKKREQALNLVQNSTHIPEQYRGMLIENIQNQQGLFNQPLSLPNKWLGATDYVNFTKSVVPDSMQQIDEQGGVKTSSKGLTQREITTRLLPIATMPDSEFMRQEMFVAQMEAPSEGIVEMVLDSEQVQYNLSNPDDKRKYVQAQAAKRVEENLYNASAATAFNQESVQTLPGSRSGSSRARSGAIESRMRIENYLGTVMKLPVSAEADDGYTKEGMSFREWMQSDPEVDNRMSADLTKNIRDHVRNFGYTIGDDGLSVYLNGNRVSSEEDADIYSMLGQRALLDKKIQASLQEIEEINNSAFKQALSQTGLSEKDVSLGSDGTIIWKNVPETNRRNTEPYTADNVDSYVIAPQPVIEQGVLQSQFNSKFEENRNRITRGKTSREPVQFTGYSFPPRDGNGNPNVGKQNMEGVLTDAFQQNTAEFKLRLPGSSDLVFINENGMLQIGTKEFDEYKDIKFVATGFSLAAENGKPVVVGKFVHGKDEQIISELRSVSARGESVNSNIVSIVGQDEFSKVQFAHQIVGSMESSIPRINGGKAVFDSNFLNSFGINSVANPNYDEFDSQSVDQFDGIIDNIQVENKNGAYRFTVKYAGIDQPKIVIKNSTIDFLRELPNILQSGYEAQQKLETYNSQQAGVGFSSDNPTVNFVVKQEGFLEQPYVPTANNRVIANSGVTIGAGIDLGQQSVDSLKSFGFDDNFIAKVEPYIGLRRSDATDSLRRSPLSFNANEIQQIREVTPRVIQSYATSASRDIGVDYGKLPEAAQSVIASVAYHKGPNFFAGRNGQALGRAIKSGDYTTAGRILREMGNREPVFRSRRNREAALIESLSRNRA